MQKATQCSDVPPIVVRLSAKERVSRIGSTVLLVMLPLVTMVASGQGFSFLNVAPVLIAALLCMTLGAWNEFLRLDGAGVAWRMGIGRRGRVSWVDVVNIAEAYGAEWRWKGCGVTLQTRAGKVFIPDWFALDGSALADLLMERWQAAWAVAPCSGLDGEGHAR